MYTFIKQNGVFDEQTSKRLFAQMLNAIEYCHKKLRICHHDVKLENFCLTNNADSFNPAHVGLTLKLIDFGFAVELEECDETKIKVYDG